MQYDEIRFLLPDPAGRPAPGKRVNGIDTGMNIEVWGRGAILKLCFAWKKESRVLHGKGKNGDLVSGAHQGPAERRIEIGYPSPQGMGRTDADYVQNLKINFISDQV